MDNRILIAGAGPAGMIAGYALARQGIPVTVFETAAVTPHDHRASTVHPSTLDMLAELGITVLELMPLAEFPGRFGWGYDGVDLFAPSHLYGRPDDLRALVDEAHALGMGVLLDVVYNHLGPDGNYLSQFADTFFSQTKTEWGDALNFDGEGAELTRAFFRENAVYWIDEFHFDGLRFDATQQIFDRSEPHILLEIITAARAAAAPRKLVMIAENEPQDARLVRGGAERVSQAMWTRKEPDLAARLVVSLFLCLLDERPPTAHVSRGEAPAVVVDVVAQAALEDLQHDL